ncbi:MAG: hypothetical protein IJL26_00490 [Clostridia bacterium]|nr:hypothetical protein [Clostridia bacterium]
MAKFTKRSDRKKEGAESPKNGFRMFGAKEKPTEDVFVPATDMRSPFDTQEGALFRVPESDKSGEFNPIPETRADVEHQIRSVQLEHSDAEGAPAEGSKFDDAPAGEGSEKKFIPAKHAQPETDGGDGAEAGGAAEENAGNDAAPEQGPTQKFEMPAQEQPAAAVPGRTKQFPAAKEDGEPAPTGELPVPAAEEAEQAAPPKKSRRTPPVDATPEARTYPEYTSADNIGEIKKFLFREKKSFVLRLCVCGVCALVSALISVIAALSSADGLTIFGGSGTAYISTQLLLLLIGCAPMAKEYAGVIRKLPKKIFGADAAVLCMWIAVLLQDLILYTAPEKICAPCRLYNAAALVVTFAVGVVRLITLTRTAAGFRILISKKEKRAVGPIRDPHRSERIGSGLLDPDAKIGYAFKTGFIENYINAMLTDDPSAEQSSRLLPISLGVSALLALVAGIVAKDVHAAFCAFAALVTVTAPLSANLALHIMRNNANAKLEPSGGVIPNYASARAFAANDALIYDAAELFDARSASVLGMRSFNGFNEYQAIVYAAAMLIGLGCPLGDLFYQVIGGDTEILPKADTLLYEDKQGISGWINDEIVLLGGRTMMNNHNIEVLTADREMKYIDANPDRRILYLAVSGRVVAMFLASYRLEQSKAEDLNYLSRRGYTLLLKSTDQNINETFTEQQLSLHSHSVKIISPEAASYFKLCRDESIPDAGTCPFTSGKGLRAILRLEVAAIRLQNAFLLTRTICLVGLALGAVLTALLFFFGSAASVTGVYVVLLQALWTGICIGACRFIEKR